jgi:hypothetical protein
LTIQYAIRCTPGGLLKDEATDKAISFATYVEAETEALRLTREAYNNPRMAGYEMAPPTLKPRQKRCG